MTAAFLQKIDWHQPWLVPFQAIVAPILAAPDWRAALNAAARDSDLRNHRGLPIHFVPQAALPSGVAYEAFISATGGVPTRDNLHDFFNALVWLTFPQIKQQLNALQAAEIARRSVVVGTTGTSKTMRGKVRDAATIFDENAALLVCADEGWLNALRDHRWHDALWLQQSVFGQAVGVFLFGHALIEKLVTPYKAITAHAWVVPADREFFAMTAQEKMTWLDTAVAHCLANGLAAAEFTPLPVLGVPGWWAGQTESFYADAMVFRPKRIKGPYLKETPS